MAILATEKVLTLDFWKRANKLQVGDYVFDHSGKPVKVKLVQEYHSSDCYQITFNDYLTAAGDSKFGFLVETPKYRRRIADYKGVQPFRRPLKHIPVQDLLTTPLRTKSNRHSISIPTTQPIEFPYQDLPVAPFVFGYWFVNRKGNNRYTFVGGHRDYVIEKFKEYGYIPKTNHRGMSTTPSVESQLIPNIPKKIPMNYLMGSVEQRLELLRGILHAKPQQYYQKEDRFRITSVSRPFIAQMQHLVESLGIKTHLQEAKGFTLSFKSRLPLTYNQQSPKMRIHVDRRYVTNISKLPPQMCVHIETDGPTNTILIGEGFIATC